ncbi:MAG: ATP-dependent protease [Deltaproteobacteria bacterium]|nr:MAG: ATP-dependent protease [Deltaproteobacteria bacterium]
MIKPLPIDKLRKEVDPASFPFTSTADVPALKMPLGQERVMSALTFGLEIESHGYNIFLLGPPGAGKQTTATTIIEEASKSGEVPNDWLYVYNFKDGEKPLAISLPAGMGGTFRDDVARLVKRLTEEIPKAFAGDEYGKEKADILKNLAEKKSNIFQALEENANQHNFIVQRSAEGLTLTYTIDGKPLSGEDFTKLPEDKQEEINTAREEVQETLAQTINEVKELEKSTQGELRKLDSRVALAAVGHEFEELKAEYRAYSKVLDYLAAIEADVLDNIDKFRNDGSSGPPVPLPFMPQPEGVEEVIKRYRVNLLVDNSELTHSPVVFESNPSHHNLIGRLEHRAQYGAFITDYTMIKAVAFHRANGGYLILNAREVLLNPFSYEALKRVLKDEEIRMEDPGEQYRLISVTSLAPEPIPSKVKVVLLGTPWLYYLLGMHDEDFHKLFKVKGEFEHSMEDNEDNRMSYAYLVSSLSKEEGLLPFSNGALAELVEFGLREADKTSKLSTSFLAITDLVREANHWAIKEGTQMVEERHVERSIDEKIFRSDYLEERIGEMVEEGTILIDTEGAKVGQINGLSVYDMGDYAFGKPTRVTARVFLGKEGVTNIERESELGGPTHNKGVLILQGFFGSRYAQKHPLAFGATLCFEQSYGGVDGDSASSTELYALISALTNLPLRQDIAVTGSVNQMGEVQAIGGVNLKIEGFYKTCKAKGLTGTQGVMIPASNVKNLMLSREVVEAVKAGNFNIYPISTIDEGLELLTGIPAGERSSVGEYPSDSVNGMVIAKMERIVQSWKQVHSD